MDSNTLHAVLCSSVPPDINAKHIPTKDANVVAEFCNLYQLIVTSVRDQCGRSVTTEQAATVLAPR